MTVETVSPAQGVTSIGGKCEGLSGKDAVLIHQTAFAETQRGLTADVKDQAVHVLNAKFELAVAAKENDIRAERLAREHLVAMNDLRRELSAQVQIEGEKTRAMVSDIEGKRQAALIVQLQAQLLKVAA